MKKYIATIDDDGEVTYGVYSTKAKAVSAIVEWHNNRGMDDDFLKELRAALRSDGAYEDEDNYCACSVVRVTEDKPL